MRGKGSMVEITCCKAGITPAYAGKSHIQKTSNAEKWDHPRLCGEKQKPKKSAHIRGGITPAYAGKSPALK